MSEVRRNIVWIASYPKSGNTWVRFLLCNLLFGEVHSAAVLNRLVPDIHEPGTELDPGAPGILVKTHFMRGPNLPLLERTSAAIYVVRDPADVLASNFHYQRRRVGGGEPTTVALTQYFETFMQHRGEPRWRELGMGSWDENVQSWLGEPHAFPVQCIRYEDLASDPRRVCGMLAELLRPQSSAEEVERAVANSSFQRLREIEAADIRERRTGIFYKPYLQPSIDAGLRFMREGTAGGGAAALTAEQRARMRTAFAPVLRQLGYPV
jgi:hypothetical protein